jgi:hypothetical protein
VLKAQVRRLNIAWLLSLLLVFAQQGAVLHELGHLSHGDRGSAPALRADVQLLDGACSTCAAFAVVANPASGATSTFAASAAVYLPTPAPVYATVAADIPTPRNRGPPQA